MSAIIGLWRPVHSKLPASATNLPASSQMLQGAVPAASAQIQPDLIVRASAPENPAVDLISKPASEGMRETPSPSDMALPEIASSAATVISFSTSNKTNVEESKHTSIATGTQVNSLSDSPARNPEIELHSRTLRLEVSGPPRKLVYPSCPHIKARGKVNLKALIGPDGAVREVTILSGNKVLSDAAARAVRQWRYDPAPIASTEREANVGVLFVASDVVSLSFPKLTATP